MSQGRYDEVNAIMKNCAQINGKSLPNDLLPNLQVSSGRMTYNRNFVEQNRQRARNRLIYSNVLNI